MGGRGEGDPSDSPFVHWLLLFQQNPTPSQVHWRMKPQVSNGSSPTPGPCTISLSEARPLPLSPLPRIHRRRAESSGINMSSRFSVKQL